MRMPSHLIVSIGTVIALYMTEFKEYYMQVIGGVLFLIIFLFAGYWDASKEDEVKDEIR